MAVGILRNIFHKKKNPEYLDFGYILKEEISMDVF